MFFLWLLNFLFLLHHRQDRIDHGELIRWTKGFGAPNTEGRDVAEMFITSLKAHVSVTFVFFPHSHAECTPILCHPRDVLGRARRADRNN